MKEQLKSAVLPPLPIVGKLKLSSRDGKTICLIEVVDSAETRDLDPLFNKAFKDLKAFLSGESKTIDLPLDFSNLTPFQMKVLKVMKTIPYGNVITYRDIATKLKSRAYQAIGNACGKNPFMIIYPCHRVVGTGTPGGFAHGLKMKKDLLKLEGHSLNVH